MISIVGGLLMLFAIGAIAYSLAPIFEKSVTRGLSEEKSYFKHAGSYFQLRHELRGQNGNLETWDEAEALVTTVQATGPQGILATWSDQIEFLPESLRLDPRGQPMCVIRMNSEIYVVRGVKRRVEKCEPVTPGFGVSNVESGELLPSSDGRAEIYYQEL